MKRRILCLLLALTLAALCTVPAFAAYIDIGGHWAESDINRATQLGLFSGMSATEFAPGLPMTRAMLVTVLGRLAGISTKTWQEQQWMLKYKFVDVNANGYYAPYLTWATLHGVVNGMSYNTFAPNDNVTREQLATMFANFLKKEGYVLTTSGYTGYFTDSASISSWAKSNVEYLASAGIIRGLPDGKGGVYFAPRQNATRAECATMFCRLIDAMKRSTTPSYITAILFKENAVQMNVGQSMSVEPTLLPTYATNQTLVWLSNQPDVVRVDNNGKMTARKAGTCKVFALSDRTYAEISVTVSGDSLATGSMSYSEKCMYVYGKYINGENTGGFREVYTSEAEARSYQVTISVPIWVVVNGTKVSRTTTVQLHRNLAPTVKQIFQDIYDAADKPPIRDVGGWRWRSYEKSEHNMGTALDLSYLSNPYVSAGADPYAAGYRPGDDPYSIPIGGTIDRIFQSYGFRRGIYWNSGARDYMHYSFFGW